MLANERTITLWEDKAHQFVGALQATHNVHVFAVVSGLLAKGYSAGRPTLSSTDATKCYLNIPYKPLNDLRNAVVAATAKSMATIQPPANRQIAPAGVDSLKHLTIREILEYHLLDGERFARCVCYAEIVAFLDGDAWCNNCCTECGHRVQLIGQDYYCYICAQDVCELKQRILVRVRDPSATTTFAIFSKDVANLIYTLIDEVTGGGNQGNPTAEIPVLLGKVVGQKCVFDVKICPYNTNLGYEDYTVVKLSQYVPPGDEMLPENSSPAAAEQGPG